MAIITSLKKNYKIPHFCCKYLTMWTQAMTVSWNSMNTKTWKWKPNGKGKLNKRVSTQSVKAL